MGFVICNLQVLSMLSERLGLPKDKKVPTVDYRLLNLEVFYHIIYFSLYSVFLLSCTLSPLSLCTSRNFCNFNLKKKKTYVCNSKKLL